MYACWGVAHQKINLTWIVAPPPISCILRRCSVNTSTPGSGMRGRGHSGVCCLDGSLKQTCKDKSWWLVCTLYKVNRHFKNKLVLVHDSKQVNFRAISSCVRFNCLMTKLQTKTIEEKSLKASFYQLTSVLLTANTQDRFYGLFNCELESGVASHVCDKKSWIENPIISIHHPVIQFHFHQQLPFLFSISIY